MGKKLEANPASPSGPRLADVSHRCLHVQNQAGGQAGLVLATGSEN